MANQYDRSAELVDDRPLDARRLAAIWRELPERERYPFILALDERIADQVIVLTHEQSRVQ